MPDDELTITINGREIPATKGQLVIDAAEKNGVFIPRFCYHPRMNPVGMCRMCIVDIDTGRGPALQPACMIQVAPDMKVDTESSATRKAQDGVLEFLLANHPLDCPVCDKGGECPLQDNAYAYGPGESRFVEEKRHFEKPIPVSSLVLLDRERCILCDRCTRFASEVAGDPLIHFQHRGSQTEVNTFPDHPFASYFSGNTVQICPVGALTASPFRFRARPWDLEKVESTCTSCAVGCRVTIETSRNHILRYQGVDIDPVNWGWLCDKGRFDFEAIESADRLDEPLVRKADDLIGATWAEAVSAAAEALRSGLDGDPTRVAAIGGSRFTNEAAYAWAKLLKGVVGTDNVDCQLGDGLPGLAVAGLPQATIGDVCTAGGTVIVATADAREELPVLYLRLRDAVVERGVRIVELSPVPTSITPLAAVSIRHHPSEAHLAMAAIVAGGDPTGLDGDVDMARSLTSGSVTCVLGRQSVAESPDSVVEAAAVLLDAKPDARFLVALRRANARGAIDMGLAPGLLPGRVALDDGRQVLHEHWDRVPAATGLDAAGILQAAADGKIDALVLLGADPITDFPDHDLAKRALAGARAVVAVDTFATPSVRSADVVLAAAGYAETAGTTTNIEGRVSILRQKVTPPGTARQDWMLAVDIADRLGVDLGIESVDGAWAEIEQVAPAHAGITAGVLGSVAAEDGVMVPIPADVARAAEGTPVDLSRAPASDSPPESSDVVPAMADPAAAEAGDEEAADEETPDAPQSEETESGPPLVTFVRDGRYSGPARDSYSLRLVAVRKLYDNGTLVQHSGSLSGLTHESALRVNPVDLQRLGVADGGEVKVSSARTSATLTVVADERVRGGTATMLVNQGSPDPFDFIDAGAAATDLRVDRV
jgi:NADH-quinone oxidoreductase subunit G